jgi:hypothetical protein
MKGASVLFAGIPLVAVPSQALACSPSTVTMHLSFVPAQTLAVICLLAFVWVGGKKVWMGHLQLALLSAAAAYVYAYHATYWVEDTSPLFSGHLVEGIGILSSGCGGETQYNIAGLIATWGLLTLGLYAAGKPLFTAFTPTIPYRLLAQTIRWFSTLVVFGMYTLLVLSFLVRLYTAP